MFKSLTIFMPDFKASTILEIGSKSDSSEYETVLKDLGVGKYVKHSLSDLSSVNEK